MASVPGSRTLADGAPPTRLICFAHAGGGAGRFRRWPDALDAGAEVIPVVLPGRDGRFHERPLTSIEEIATIVLAERPCLARARVALAGISFGALVAFEVACRLQAQGAPPLALFLASPRGPNGIAAEPPWHTLSDAQLIDKIVEMEGFDEAPAERAELIELFIDVIRADLRASETYSAPPGAMLNCPLFVYYGVYDPVVSSEEAERWRDQTTGESRIRSFVANHFLTDGSEDLWVAALRQDLARIRALESLPVGDGSFRDRSA